MIKTKEIFSPRIARKLIAAGFTVVDIRPNDENRDKTVFIFEGTDEFYAEFDKIKKNSERNAANGKYNEKAHFEHKGCFDCGGYDCLCSDRGYGRGGLDV